MNVKNEVQYYLRAQMLGGEIEKYIVNGWRVVGKVEWTEKTPLQAFQGRSRHGEAVSVLLWNRWVYIYIKLHELSSAKCPQELRIL